MKPQLTQPIPANQDASVLASTEPNKQESTMGDVELKEIINDYGNVIAKTTLDFIKGDCLEETRDTIYKEAGYIAIGEIKTLIEQERQEGLDNLMGLVVRNCNGFIERDGELRWQLDMYSLEQDLKTLSTPQEVTVNKE